MCGQLCKRRSKAKRSLKLMNSKGRPSQASSNNNNNNSSSREGRGSGEGGSNNNNNKSLARSIIIAKANMQRSAARTHTQVSWLPSQHTQQLTKCMYVCKCECAFYNSLLQYVNDFNGKQPKQTKPPNYSKKLITNYDKRPKQKGTSKKKSKIRQNELQIRWETCRKYKLQKKQVEKAEVLFLLYEVKDYKGLITKTAKTKIVAFKLRLHWFVLIYAAVSGRGEILKPLCNIYDSSYHSSSYNLWDMGVHTDRKENRALSVGTAYENIDFMGSQMSLFVLIIYYAKERDFILFGSWFFNFPFYINLHHLEYLIIPYCQLFIEYIANHPLMQYCWGKTLLAICVNAKRARNMVNREKN